MGEIAVIHMDLMSKGGGEAVAMNVLEALQEDHDVTVLTLTDPDLDELNAYFDTSVDTGALTVERAGYLAPWMNQQFGLKYYVLQNALLGRYARRRSDDFDLLVSTINELGLQSDSVQYVHFPFDWTVSCDKREHIFHPTVEEDSLYERLATRVAGVDRKDIQQNALLANSEWTADVVEDAYDTRPRIVHPPVDTREFEDRPWDEREEGIVTVGRIERSKRIKELVEITAGVRERGHEVHLHVIGPTVDDEYRQEVEAMVAGKEYVELEGELPREELVERICNHKYGIHGKQYEHFGMAVAELAAGGTIPFVPNDGGQHAIVNDREELLYDSIEDAMEKIATVADDPDLQRQLRQPMGPEAIRRRFGRQRFQRQIRRIVAEALDRPSAEVPEAPADAPAERPASSD